MGRLAARSVPALLALALLGCAGGHAGHVGHGGPGGSGGDAVAENVPFPVHPLAEGKALALEQKKPLIVDFYAPEGCSRCDRLATHVYSKPEIARRLRDEFVVVRIDLTRNLTSEEIELGRRYEYKYDCLLVFLDGKGEVIEDLSGKRMCFADFIAPEWFLGHLDRAQEVNAARMR